ncbi:homoserine O-acetyltransferase, partial [Listeria monocytogenes]
GYELLKEWDVPVTYHEVASEYGHDAFLVKKEVPKFEPLIRSFLSNLPVKSI